MPDTDPTRNFVRRVSLLGRRIRRQFDKRAGEHGLTQARALVLLNLDQHGSMSQAELAEAMEVERPTMARLIDAMESCGHVRREMSSRDRRVRTIVVTEEAQGELRALRALSAALRDRVLAGIPEADIEVADRVIRQMIDNIDGAGVGEDGGAGEDGEDGGRA